MAAQHQQGASTSGRSDGRGPEEFRDPFFNTRVISQAKGSAYAEFGRTKVMVGVYGPRPSERKLGFSESGTLNCDVRLASFAAPGQGGRQQQQALERTLSDALHTALCASIQLHAIPKSTVDVYALLLEAGGSDLAVTVAAASVALADAGIECYDMTPACTVSRVGGRLLLDPTVEEEARQEGRVTLSLMPATQEVTQLLMQGAWGESESKEAIELCMGACAHLKSIMREALLMSL